ncbi:hydrogenase expression/formation protein HypE [Saccharolobus shibatae]|uniref:[NiFe] hydrogenase metallocenter assembly protein HypE n=1 Tax=Saccharolobus shibatae TaxID=2286 RepID=A0A8F5GZN2_9CREN|nr:hydrogenase expression/formation protein HypE [Saccharolobus shibatae]QXJ35533.1 [NiFe] hydrogenase metallocenter assembly protein HypE [Saccharolobus shibatae]
MTDRILLAHGNGGKETQEILNRLIFSKLPDYLKKTKSGVGIDYPDDGAVLSDVKGKIVVATDSHTVNPYFFPGGSIGTLAATGTINDIVMMGAEPIAMLDSIVVSEGFPLDDLDKILTDMINILKENNIPLVGGDFKVMPRDSMPGIVINTVGIGITENPILDRVQENDVIIVTGPIGVHGALIASLQYGIEASLKSDVNQLTKLLKLFHEFPTDIHGARDPTRGGIAATLNEWAQLSDKMIIIEEKKIPIPEEVKSVTQITGLDPLVLANEGVAVLSVANKASKEIVRELENLGFEPKTIGKVVEPIDPKNKRLVIVRTEVGGAKILEMPTGDIVPRIC